MEQLDYLLDAIKETLKDDSLTLQDKILVDSLKFVEVIIALEEVSKKNINIENIYKNSYQTYGDLIENFIGVRL